MASCSDGKNKLFESPIRPELGDEGKRRGLSLFSDGGQRPSGLFEMHEKVQTHC